MKKIYLSYEDYELYINDLVDKIKKGKEKFDGVYGVPRGGLPIAVHLSHHLNLPLLTKPTKETLVVDDISDTGETLENIKHKRVACIYSTIWTKTEPDYFVAFKVGEETWIVFPWEVKSL
jgi:hypoxanthine phosphoribosyltransferase